MNKTAVLQFCVCLLAASGAAGQTASVTGLVEDPSKAAIQNASVSVTSEETGIVRRGVTNAQGFYNIPQFLQGTYSIQAEAPGFQSRIRAGIRLDEGQALRVDLPLAVGAANDTLKVTEDAPALETESSSQSTVVGNKAIIDLPLNGRNPLAFATLVRACG
jgi:hypothetical protein